MEQKTYFAEPILFNRSTTLLGRGIAMYTYQCGVGRYSYRQGLQSEIGAAFSLHDQQGNIRDKVENQEKYFIDANK